MPSWKNRTFLARLPAAIRQSRSTVANELSNSDKANLDPSDLLILFQQYFHTEKIDLRQFNFYCLDLKWTEFQINLAIISRDLIHNSFHHIRLEGFAKR